MFDAPRRRRRRRVIWPILATVVAIVAVIVATAGDDARATISYLEDMRSRSVELTRAGSTLNDLVGDLSRVDRSEFQSVVMGVEEALTAASEVAEQESPEEALLGVSSLFRLAVESWTEGIAGASEAILRAADDPTDASPVDDLASAVVLVRAGDTIYDALIAELSRDEVPSPVGEMPDVRLLPVDTPVTVLAPAWISAARSEGGGLALRPSVRIEQVATSPEWVTSADGSVVVPATDVLDVAVVVGNAGNTEAEAGGDLELTFSTAGAEPVVITRPVPAIGTGASTSVIFTDLAVLPGVSYQINLILTPGGPDAFIDDNRHSTGFVVNAATETTDTTTGG
jgi:hypothetical protein